MQAGKVAFTHNMRCHAAVIAASAWLYSATLLAATCALTAPTMNFGSYDPLSTTPTDSITNIQITCTRTVTTGAENVAYALSLSSGTGTFASRTMLNGIVPLNYNLFTSSNRDSSTIWGNGTGGSVLIVGSLQPLDANFPTRTVSHPLYGRVPARQDIPIGSYSASVILTMTF